MNGGSSNDQRSGEELLWKRVQCLAHSGCIRLKQSLTLAFKGRSKKVHAQTPHGSGSLGSPAKPEAARPAALAESIEHDLYQAMSFPPQSARLPMTSTKVARKTDTSDTG